MDVLISKQFKKISEIEVTTENTFTDDSDIGSEINSEIDSETNSEIDSEIDSVINSEEYMILDLENNSDE